MPLQYKITPRSNPLDPEAPVRYYIRPVHSGRSGIDQLAWLIAGKSTVHRTDIVAVLDLMQEVIPELLADGDIVDLGELGSFYLTVQSAGADTEEEATARNIRSVRIRYRPGKKMLAKVQRAKFERQD